MLGLGFNRNLTFQCAFEQVFLNPKPDLSSLPLKSYYRLALPSYSTSGALAYGSSEPNYIWFLWGRKVIAIVREIPRPKWKAAEPRIMLLP